MRILLLLIAVCLTGCSAPLILNSPAIPDRYKQRCSDAIADPLTTGDQYDEARALGQAIKYGRTCAALHDSLIDAVDTREAVMQSISDQLKKSH
jgi:hypothetical protein